MTEDQEERPLRLATACILVFSTILVMGAFVVREQYVMDEAHLSPDDHIYTVVLEKGHRYELAVAIRDIERYRAEASADVRIFVQNRLVFEGFLSTFDVAKNPALDAHASIGRICVLNPTEDVNVRVEVRMYDGDEWEVKVYRDISPVIEQITSHPDSILLGSILLVLAVWLSPVIRRRLWSDNEGGQNQSVLLAPTDEDSVNEATPDPVTKEKR